MFVCVWWLRKYSSHAGLNILMRIIQKKVLIYMSPRFFFFFSLVFFFFWQLTEILIKNLNKYRKWIWRVNRQLCAAPIQRIGVRMENAKVSHSSSPAPICLNTHWHCFWKYHKINNTKHLCYLDFLTKQSVLKNTKVNPFKN